MAIRSSPVVSRTSQWSVFCVPGVGASSETLLSSLLKLCSACCPIVPMMSIELGVDASMTASIGTQGELVVYTAVDEVAGESVSQGN
eukprot:scaffold84749_cov69-Phaeocystis_antarctica.AAC.7